MTIAGGLLGDLGVPEGGDATQLTAAHEAVASALAGGQRETLSAGVGGGTLADVGRAAAVVAPAATGSAAAAPLVLRRDLPLQPLTGPGALPAWSVGRAAETSGPLLGALGQPVYVDRFPRVEGTALHRASQSSPLLRVAGTTLRWLRGGQGRIGQGSVWLAANQFDATAAPGSWIGLTVSGGTVTGARATPGPGGTLVVPDGVTLTVELELLAPPVPAGQGPGEDARAADVRLPGQASFVLAPGGGQVAGVAAALLTAYGETVRFDGVAGRAGILATLGALLVPLTPALADWHAATHSSTLATLSGGGTVHAAGWALPLTVADPSTLGAAGGAGMLAMRVDDLTLTFADQSPLSLLTAWLTAEPGLLTVACDDAVGTGAAGQVSFYPDPQGGVGGRASFRYADSFAVRYLCSSTGEEAVFAEAALDVSLDRPATVAGARIPLRSAAGVLALAQSATGTVLLLEGTGDAELTQPLVLALENALLETGAPTFFLLRAEVTAQSPQLEGLTGRAAILLALEGALPTLPDPYAATVVPVARRGDATAALRSSGGGAADAQRAGRLLQARVDWDATGGPSTPSLAFSQSGASGAGLVWAATAQAQSSGVDTTAALDGVTAASFAELPTARSAGLRDAGLLAQLSALDERYTASTPGPVALLDVSSAADQFGVRYGIESDRRLAAVDVLPLAAPAASGPIIEGLSVVAPANTVRVITLPAVQWEPVSGPDATGPFSPMAFPNSGGETQVTSRSVELVSVAPVPAIDQLVTDYNRNAVAPPPVVVSITFPFGIRAVALLLHRDHPRILDHTGATLDRHEPGFGEAGVTGGQQLRARSLGGPGLLQGRGASFPGGTVQLSNGLHAGVPTSKSPLDDSITTIFNDEFPPSGWAAQVPVEQFEVSGYGESVFSDWKDDTDTDPSISEVRFDVLVGRTSVEVVQARTVMYPYAVRVIRTVKMLRDNAGRMQRTDSGWQAVTDGRYAWPAADADVHSHPGVVLGVTHVTNIQETGQTWTSPDGVQFAAVRFDGMVDLDGVASGAGGAGVPSHGQLGFLQLTETPPSGMAASFSALIAQFGPLGGRVDAVVDVGGSGQLARVAYVGVGVTEGTTGPEFPMAAWGAPILPKGGPWSVVRRSTGSPVPGPVDAIIGVPLIRAGLAGTTPSPSVPYRFADPEDLANESSPAADYALMHTTHTQRVLFLRPKVDVSGARQHQLTSTQPPLLADAFLMATAGVAPFPALQSAIAFPDADYGLRSEAGGNLRLDLPYADFPVTGGDRVIHDSGGTTFLARYRDESGTPARVRLVIDSGAAVPWSFQLGGMELCLATSLMGEVIRLLGVIEGSATEPGRFTEGTFHFGSALDAINFVTGFLGTQHLADLPIASRNQPSLEIALKIPIVGAPGEPEEIDLGIGALADADVTVGIKIDLTTGAPTVKFELDGIITGDTPWPPIVAAGQLKFDIESNAAGNLFKFTLGLGAGVNFDIGIGKAEGYFFQNDYFVVGTNEIGFGIGVEIKAKVDLEIVEVEVDVEAAALMIETTCAAGSTWWLVGQLTFGIDVTIAWVIDIDFEVQMQMQTNVDGGPCTNTPML